jgi:hypothetical protein
VEGKNVDLSQVKTSRRKLEQIIGQEDYGVSADVYMRHLCRELHDSQPQARTFGKNIKPF